MMQSAEIISGLHAIGGILEAATYIGIMALLAWAIWRRGQ
jgi:hypothetical protein